MTIRHFLTLSDLSSSELNTLIERATELKAIHRDGKIYAPLKNKVLAMVFEKSSTRTRVSFEAGMIQLGGGAIFLSPRDTQLGRGEPVADTARVLSRMADAIMIRTFAHDTVIELAKYSQVPVINALTDDHHPCQLLADIQTYTEHRGTIKGKTVAWVGDGNNMCHSYMQAAQQFDFKLNISCPDAYQPKQEMMDTLGSHSELISDPHTACKDVDLVVTDVWASMGQEEEAQDRNAVFTPYQVNSDLMSATNKNALFMHCLPAHRGEEVSADVIDGPQSVVWDEAENRLHAQKALLEFLIPPVSKES